MKRSHIHAFASLAVLLIFCSESSAKRIMREFNQSTIQRAAQAETIVVGTVTTIEPDILNLTPVSGGAKANYMVAVVKVRQPILGAKGVTHIRVGFIPSANNTVNDEDGMMFNCKLGGYPSGNGSYNLVVGQEACFFLVKHHEGDFYTLPQYCPPLAKNHFYFDDELTQIKRVVDVVRNPVESLKAKESSDRQFAAAVLFQRNRVAPQVGSGKNAPTVKTVPLSQEESKLILDGLGEMTWGDMGIDGQGTLAIQTLFWQLSLTDKEGWRQPQIKENDDYNTVMDEAVKKWLKEHSSTYRLQKSVVEPKRSLE